MFHPVRISRTSDNTVWSRPTTDRMRAKSAISICILLAFVCGACCCSHQAATVPRCLITCDVVHVQSVFKTLCGSSITRLELGGPTGQPRDRIFVASGAIVRGYTRRGKQFLDFNTNTTEAVRSLYDGLLLLCSVESLASEIRHKSSNAPSTKGMVVFEDRMRPVDNFSQLEVCV